MWTACLLTRSHTQIRKRMRKRKRWRESESKSGLAGCRRSFWSNEWPVDCSNRTFNAQSTYSSFLCTSYALSLSFSLSLCLEQTVNRWMSSLPGRFYSTGLDDGSIRKTLILFTPHTLLLILLVSHSLCFFSLHFSLLSLFFRLTDTWCVLHCTFSFSPLLSLRMYSKKNVHQLFYSCGSIFPLTNCSLILCVIVTSANVKMFLLSIILFHLL